MVAADLANRRAFQVSHPHFSSLSGDGAHAATAKRLNREPLVRLDIPHPLRPNSDHAEKVSKIKSGRCFRPPAFSVN